MEVTHGRHLRVVGVLAALYSAGYLAVLTFDTGSRLAVVVGDLGNLLSPLVAALACVLAARRCRGRSRWSWALLAGFASLWSAGQLAWCWYEVVREVAVPFPGLPDVGYLASVPLVLAALLVHPDAPRATSGLLRLAADAVLVGAALLGVSWRLFLGDAYRTSGASGPSQILGLAYPVSDVIVLTLLILVAVRARGSGNRSFPWLAACLCAGAVGHLVYGVQVQNGTWQSGSPVDAAWGVGFLFLALGAHRESGSRRREPVARVGRSGLSLLPYLPLSALAVAAVSDALEGVPTDRVSRGLGFVIFGSILARQLLALMENSRLTRGLEATVAARTSELMRTTEQLQERAWHDPLTGLPNRALLFDRIEAALAQGPLVVALLDLDGFKSINDSLGHAAGDELLDALGHRLATQLPPDVLSARLGGDEFAFLMPGCRTEQQARALGAEILLTLTEPVQIGGRSLALTGSLGLVLATRHDTSESLLRNADIAMYAAKDGGKNRLRLFEQAMRDGLLARVALEADLRVALLAGEVVPWFQPIVDLRSGRVVGVEALARWPRPGGAVSPEVFVPLAEQSGLVTVLGRQVLRAACAQAARWNALAPLNLSVNLSAVQLAGEDLVDQVREALLESGLPAERLVLEITETVLVEDAVTVVPRLDALRALGVRIALDDFGTGYCALGYLQKLPVDIVKIDRAFVTEVHLGPRPSALAAAVMTLAEALDLEVVAEGIELPEQAARLRELGCCLAQGFLFHAPLPPQEMSRIWEQQASAVGKQEEPTAVGF